MKKKNPKNQSFWKMLPVGAHHMLSLMFICFPVFFSSQAYYLNVVFSKICNNKTVQLINWVKRCKVHCFRRIVYYCNFLPSHILIMYFKANVFIDTLSFAFNSDTNNGHTPKNKLRKLWNRLQIKNLQEGIVYVVSLR